MGNETRLVPVEEASKVLGISVRTLREKVKKGIQDGVAGKQCMVAVDVRLLLGPQDAKPEKQATGTGNSAELDRLTQKREEIKVAIEVKTLEAQLAGIFGKADQERLVEREKKVAKAEENLVDREEASAESEGSLEDREGGTEDLEGREQALGIREATVATLEAELGKREEELKKGESNIKVSDDLRRRADAAADKLQTAKWDLIRFLWGARKTLERTIKGASKPITAKEAITLMWQELHFYDEIYGSYATNEKGELLVDGEPIKSWQQEEGFYDDKNTSTIKISW